MKTGKLILIFIVIIPLVLIVTGYLSFRYSGSCHPENLPAGILRDGDLVFRTGKSIESFAVVYSGSDNDFSHVGIIRMEGKMPFVIHIEPGNSAFGHEPVKLEPLLTFLDTEKASHYAVYRSSLGKEKIGKILAKALFFYRTRRCFDNNYDLLDEGRLYCTELVYRAFLSADPAVADLGHHLSEVNILVKKQMILMPGAFTHSRFFQRILYQ